MLLKDKLQRAIPVVATGINADAGTLDCYVYEGEVIVTGHMNGLKQYWAFGLKSDAKERMEMFVRCVNAARATIVVNAVGMESPTRTMIRHRNALLNRALVLMGEEVSNEVPNEWTAAMLVEQQIIASLEIF